MAAVHGRSFLPTATSAWLALICRTSSSRTRRRQVEPNVGVKEHPAGGRPCVRAYSLVQKLYNPNRVKGPMKRTNPRKGKDEDPGWVPISWDEALDMLADKLRAIREAGFVDENGYPRSHSAPAGPRPPISAASRRSCRVRRAARPGHRQRAGMKCVHSEHLYGEYWHRAFTVAADMPNNTYVLSFGSNGDVSGGVIGVWRHAEARGRGGTWVQFEPHMSITAATASEWVPIKPKTDAAVLYAIIHTTLNEHEWRGVCDVDFLSRMTNSPYLVGPNGYYVRGAASRKPLVWDEARIGVAFDVEHDAGTSALEGEFHERVSAAHEEVFTHTGVTARSSLQLLRDTL
jgi:phenylacetyl-CoA:acceptor oxidoreductase